MTTQHVQSDLTVESFLALRAGFFDDGAEPRNYRLRDKRNTQDDPLDEYVEGVLSKQLSKGIRCSRAPGALTTPDLVVMRPSVCNGTPRIVLASDLSRIVALEAKKLGFYDVERRCQVAVPLHHIRKALYKQTTDNGKIRTHYILTAQLNGTVLGKLVRRKDWLELDVPQV